MELIDILDKQGNKTGMVNSRNNVHSQGLLHAAIHILVHNSKKEILIQKRASEKDFDADKWDFVLGGHVSSGEHYEEAAIKELGEEYGIKTSLDNLKFLKTKRVSFEIPELNWHDNEINYIYLFKYGGDSNSLKLQEEEISEAKFISLENLEKEILDPIKN